MATGESKTKWNGSHSMETLSLGTSYNLTLEYEGKKSKDEILKTPAVNHCLIWKNPDLPEIAPNQLFYGDNLPALATLMQSPIKGQVQVIYIDPPFATNSIFKSRAQNDAYTDLLMGSFYLEFIRQRLIFLRELLADNGSLYIHLDGNMVFHIKIIMDEIFGRSNFRSFITRRKCNPKNYTRNTYGNISDYILFYTKTDKYIWNRAYENWTPERVEKEYQYIEQGTGRRYKKVPIHAPGTRNGETGKPWRGMSPPPGKHWQYPPSILDEMDARGEIYWSSNGNPRRKVFLDESKGIPVQDIWLDVRDAHNQNIKITGYPTEKPIELLQRIINASSEPNGIVLDCFAGSGTTLAAASQLQRRWIGIDNSTEAIRTTLYRFRYGTQPMGDYTRKKTKGLEQMPLLTNDKPVISDFALFAEESCRHDLNDVVAEWNLKSNS